ncbi:hypothetical protein WA158_006072 [Blastocystis sp. Blastoise]
MSIAINKEQVKKAIHALVQHIKVENQKKTKISIDDTKMITLIIGFSTIPVERKSTPVKIVLPHSLFDAESGDEICLFVKDKADELKDKIEKDPVEGLTRIITLDKLRSNYSRFEQRRELAGGYELFMCDDRILPMMPRCLGKAFLSKKKHPIAITIKGDISKKIREATSVAHLFLGWGPCAAIKVAKSNMDENEIFENVIHTIEVAAKFSPKNGKSIQSINIKTDDSVSLPIYNNIKEAELPSEEKKSEPITTPSKEQQSKKEVVSKPVAVEQKKVEKVNEPKKQSPKPTKKTVTKAKKSPAKKQ